MALLEKRVAALQQLVGGLAVLGRRHAPMVARTIRFGPPPENQRRARRSDSHGRSSDRSMSIAASDDWPADLAAKYTWTRTAPTTETTLSSSSGSTAAWIRAAIRRS